MSNLSITDKKILENLFGMKSGYVLGFSDRTMEEFFKEGFKIAIYDPKYDLELTSRSKANRLRGIWMKEDDKVVGVIILALVDYAETDLLTKDNEITPAQKELLRKAREIGSKLLFFELSEDFRPEVQELKNKAQLIKDFNSFDFKNLTVNQKIYLLKVFYSYYEAIIKTYYGPGLFYLTSGIDDLNDYFKILRKKIIELIKSDKTFSEMENAKAYQGLIDPMTSLYSSAEFLDGVWEDFSLPNLINFREEIADKDLFENNSEIHKVDINVNKFFEAISKEIDVLKKFLEQKEKNFYEKELPKTKEQWNEQSEKNNKTPQKNDTEKILNALDGAIIRGFENMYAKAPIQPNVQKIEITAMPELKIKSVEDNVIVKSKKRITLPKFPRTEWSKVSIKFTDDRNAILSNSIEYKPFLPESIGCVDERTNKPDTAWEFLIKIAKGQGITEPINKKDREKQKKQKQKITDILRKIFKNQTDPFESEKGGVYRALFNVEYIKEENDKILIDKKYAGLEELRSKMTEPTQENIEYDLRHNIDPDTGSEFSQ